MKPKPPPDVHRRELLRVLVAGLSRTRPEAARMLSGDESIFELVSWTHLFYSGLRDIAEDLPGIERILAEPEPTAGDIAEIESPKRRLARLWHLFGDSAPWLSRFVAHRELFETLIEVRRYLDNESGVGDRIKALLVAALAKARARRERVLLIGHSLGSVIGYECLNGTGVDGEDSSICSVDVFVTLGSPLATRFVRMAVTGADHHGRLRYPPGVRRWLNFSARGELTALHPELAPFVDVRSLPEDGRNVEDHAEIYNHFRVGGRINPHKSYGYLINAAVASRIGDWLLAV